PPAGPSPHRPRRDGGTDPAGGRGGRRRSGGRVHGVRRRSVLLVPPRRADRAPGAGRGPRVARVDDPGSPPVAEALARIRSGIAEACRRVGRSPEAVLVIGATKTVPLPRIREALAAGLRDVAENLAAELARQSE